MRPRSSRSGHDRRTGAPRPHPRLPRRRRADGGADGRRRPRLGRLDAPRRPGGHRAVPADARGLRGADARLRGLRLLGPPRGAQLQLGAADGLQAGRDLGQPRGLDAALDAHPHPLRRHGGGLGRQPAALPARPRPRRAGHDRRRLLRLHPRHLEPLRAPRRPAARRQRPQPAAAGPGPRHPSPLPLPRLCRPLDGLFLRHRRADRGPRRRRLGALGAALDAPRLGLPHRRHRHGLDLGLLRARLGRLVVLGPGRERELHALADLRRAPPLRHRGREARHPEKLDRSSSPSSPSPSRSSAPSSSAPASSPPSTPSPTTPSAASTCSGSSAPSSAAR